MGKQSIWLTSELFKFIPEADLQTGVPIHYYLRIGTPKLSLGEIVYKAHWIPDLPASIQIILEGGRWFVSFSTEDTADHQAAVARARRGVRRVFPVFN